LGLPNLDVAIPFLFTIMILLQGLIDYLSGDSLDLVVFNDYVLDNPHPNALQFAKEITAKTPPSTMLLIQVVKQIGSVQERYLVAKALRQMLRKPNGYSCRRRYKQSTLELLNNSSICNKLFCDALKKVIKEINIPAKLELNW
jgi:hypothetical protein